MFGEGCVPEKESDDNLIRASFLRDLLLSEAGLGAKGLRIRGGMDFWKAGPARRAFELRFVLHAVSFYGCA
jgi:hypothetical protein